MDENEELRRRQATVKECRARYGEALKLRRDQTDEPALLNEFKARLEEQGVKLNAEEVIMGIVLLESLLDFEGETTLEDLQAGILVLLLDFVGELDSKWSDRDLRFFTD